MPEPNFACSFCNMMNYKQPSRLTDGNNFCDRKCFANFRYQQQEVSCLQCHKLIHKKQSRIKGKKNHFCSKSCFHNFNTLSQFVACCVCLKNFKKKRCDIKRFPRHCCSRECRAILNRELKDWSTSRSKLEILIEKVLSREFASLNILYNKTRVGYELDIHIPCLNLAIELNGPHHYFPIYGEEKLRRVQETDRNKVIECEKRNIDLVVINVSKDGRSKKILDERVSQVINLIHEKLFECHFNINQSLNAEF